MNIKNSIFIDKYEIKSQNDIINQIYNASNKPKKYYIVTYGCQMNVNDSQKLSYMLDSIGINESSNKNDADIIIFNTCCIRENAERKALGNIMWLKELKKSKPNLIIAVCGCMIQQPEMLNLILKQYKFVDIAFGTHNLHNFPELLLAKLTTNKQIIEIVKNETIIEGLKSKRDIKYHAYLTIMYGCDNFCTYCIVPYVRGRERSRSFTDVINDAKNLLDQGVKEIMLLGQNVNSYGENSDENKRFPQLLKQLDELAVPRIRFMTSHPKDLSAELIEVMANSKYVAKHIHLPVQSGSNNILKLMNRKYTREQYLELIKKLRKNMPDIGITTDIIVGFPGETEYDFNQTLDLVELVKFDSAFTFIYSKRKGTVAAGMENLIDSETSKRRLQKLNKLINKHAYDILNSQIGLTEILLIEGINSKNRSFVYGKTSRNIKVNVLGNNNDIGEFVNIKIVKIENNVLVGERI